MAERINLGVGEATIGGELSPEGIPMLYFCREPHSRAAGEAAPINDAPHAIELVVHSEATLDALLRSIEALRPFFRPHVVDARQMV